VGIVEKETWLDGRVTWASTTKAPLRDADGRIVGTFGISRDITDRVLAEQEQRERLERVQRQQAAMLDLATHEAIGAGDLEAALTHITEAVSETLDVERVGVWLLSDDGQELHCTHLFERSAARHSAGAVLQATDAPRYFGALTAGRAIAARDAQSDPRTSEFADYLLAHGITSMLDAAIRVHGRVAGIICQEHVGPPRTWHEDESTFAAGAADQVAQALLNHERRRMEALLREAQRLESLGVLAGGIAHDFNNLLTAILGNADLVLRELPPDSPACGNVQEVLAAAERAARLAGEMLAYSGRGRFLTEPVDLSTLVGEMVNLLRVSISKNAVLEQNLARGLPAIEGDVAQLNQTVMNLITNASEALGNENGVVAISTGVIECDRAYLDASDLAFQASRDDPLPEGRYVYLEVADTGCGMDAETRGRVFDPFFTTKRTGRGLGMAAVLGIVRGHRGAIRLDTEPGRGTTFRVLFPAAGDVSVRPLPEPESPHDAFPRDTGAVLVVDDEKLVRALARHMLKFLGLGVFEAEDGQQAVELFREHADSIACVILDLTMPRLSGEETLRELRRIRPCIPVILSSGYSEEEIAGRFGDDGPTAFLDKPYSEADLARTLRKALRAGKRDGE